MGYINNIDFIILCLVSGKCIIKEPEEELDKSYANLFYQKQHRFYDKTENSFIVFCLVKLMNEYYKWVFFLSQQNQILYLHRNL